MSYRFKATEKFWKNFYSLSSSSKAATRNTWEIFKADPFDSRLGTHKINSLSARAKQTVYSVLIEADLRAVFVIDGDVITTLDIGTHSIYK